MSLDPPKAKKVFIHFSLDENGLMTAECVEEAPDTAGQLRPKYTRKPKKKGFYAIQKDPENKTVSM